MRIKEINKWINEGGSLPQNLTEEEKDHLTKLGWSLKEEWHGNGEKWYEQHYLHGKRHGKWEMWGSNGQKWYEKNFFHGMKHGVFKDWWYEDGSLYRDEEYFYGNKIK